MTIINREHGGASFLVLTIVVILALLINKVTMLTYYSSHYRSTLAHLLKARQRSVAAAFLEQPSIFANKGKALCTPIEVMAGVINYQITRCSISGATNFLDLSFTSDQLVNTPFCRFTANTPYNTISGQPIEYDSLISSTTCSLNTLSPSSDILIRANLATPSLTPSTSLIVAGYAEIGLITLPKHSKPAVVIAMGDLLINQIVNTDSNTHKEISLISVSGKVEIKKVYGHVKLHIIGNKKVVTPSQAHFDSLVTVKGLKEIFIGIL